MSGAASSRPPHSALSDKDAINGRLLALNAEMAESGDAYRSFPPLPEVEPPQSERLFED